MSDENVTMSEHEAASQLLASFLMTTVQKIVIFDALGMILAFFVTGYCTALAIQYYCAPTGRKDPLWMRVFIAFMLILLATQLGTQLYEMLMMMLNINTYYMWFSRQTVMFLIEIGLYGIFMAPLSLAFVGLRTWKLYNRPRIAGAVGLILVSGMIVLGCLTFSLIGSRPDDDAYGSPQEILEHLNPAWGQELHKRVFAVMVMDMILNIAMTIANLIKFRSFLDEDSQTNGQSKRVIDKLFAMTMQSMLPSCCGSIVLGYFYISNTQVGSVVRMISHIQPSLYVLACLTAVTAKSGLEKALLSNNLEISVIVTDTELQGDETKVGHMLSFGGGGLSTAGGVDKEFFDFLASGPVEERRKTPNWGEMGISFGKSKVVLADEEKGSQ